MKAKTKAQELGFLSRDYAVAKDKKKWLSLFADDAIVQDPIGAVSYTHLTLPTILLV